MNATKAEIIACQSLEELAEVAKKIIKFAGSLTIWAFEGEMGAGKTTLIKAICQELGVEDSVQSPTYALVNEYESRQQGTIYHFDFYRLKTPEEAYDLGYEEYFESGNLCFIEWPSKIEELIPSPHLRLRLTVSAAEQIRTIELIKQ